MYQNSKAHIDNLNYARSKANKKTKYCSFCDHNTTPANIKRHELMCYLNPINKTLCPNCQKPIKNYKHSKTCSTGCYNSLFRNGPNNPNWKESSYASTCFHFHKKECVICQELNIVEVHHLDENNQNNSPENLIPMCPTHHQYWHSRFKHLVEDQVLKYIQNWKLQNK